MLNLFRRESPAFKNVLYSSDLLRVLIPIEVNNGQWSKIPVRKNITEGTITINAIVWGMSSEKSKTTETRERVNLMILS